MPSARFAVLLPALALAACGTGMTSSGSGRTATIHDFGRPNPRIQSAPGLKGVIGASRDALVREFGQPRLDVREEDAVKLQWRGVPCILDVYLYPPNSGGVPIATWIDARRGDGRDVDRAACIAALRSLQGAR